MIALWLTSTLVWWAFAFMPLPSTPPAWVTAARVACFGSMESGLPAVSGWMLLVLAPLTFLVAMVAIWGAELRTSVVEAVRSPVARGAVVVIAAVILTEATWVVGKVQTARAATTIAAVTRDDGQMPTTYPRGAAPAPELALVDQHGHAVSLARFTGRPVIVTFVYAHCQTMCPMIVETLKDAAPATSEVLLVTLDPWRDTPNLLPEIARQWEVPAHFHVLSSRRVDDVLRVTASYGVPFERDRKSGEIEHPGLVFLIDPAGRLAYTFNNPSTAWVREALARLGTSHADRG